MNQNDLQQTIIQAQSIQQQLHVLHQQKEALNLQMFEMNKALEELGKTKEEEVYKVTGPILVKVSRADARSDLDSKKEMSMLRMKTVEKSEASAKKQMEGIREKLSKSGM